MSQPSLTCFICSRCGFPICTAADIIRKPVCGGTTDEAFVYNFEDMLNLEPAVPCYSRREVVKSSVYVSPEVLELPLSSSARRHALQAVEESENAQGRVLSNVEDTLKDIEEEERVTAAYADDPSLDHEAHQTEPEQLLHGDQTTGITSSTVESSSTSRTVPQQGPHARRVEDDVTGYSYTSMGLTTESRMDIVGVSYDVLGVGVLLSQMDRSDAVPSAVNGSQIISEHLSGTQSIDPDFSDPVRDPPKPTAWKAPGNLEVEECFIKVERCSLAGTKPWFTNFKCSSRVECPECHLGLGFAFERITKSVAECSYQKDTEDAGKDVVEPCSKKGKTEASLCTTVEEETTEFPDCFLGLEIKNLRPSEWSLRDFQSRYTQTKNVETFRELFPGVEELQSFYSRLTALRTQAALYHNLLRKHKEQHEVQSAILQTQKSRMEAYEGRLKTMQEIISSQRAQLVAQVDRLLTQNEYIKAQSRKMQMQTERFQIERMISTEKDQTINILREEVALLRDLNAATLREGLNVEDEEPKEDSLPNSGHIDDDDIEEQHEAQNLNPSDSDSENVNISDLLNEYRATVANRPPAHLCGIMGVAPTNEE